ncbi:flavin reductase family protein [Planotetraspora sp. A-T 1434]|uniref:flavin reductase family protein n=1 Tax=Planotetraspora sp. A-T 1434 TaxID=2979219 RepID=UPI0021C1CB42|nr:flavin reductase family protein [Planotetraspora sp. A-T 1434]MCT9930334.1 flavin reductase family protein [Planotetraspora sp. A-T 1434]
MSVDAVENGLPGVGGAGDVFLSAFRRHAAGVAVVTALSKGGPVGFTATSVASVSLDPPLLSFGISVGASSWPAIRDTDSFVVHILSAGQRDVAGLFARKGADRFGPRTRWSSLPTGEPVLDGVAAWLRCSVQERFIAGDHRLVIGLVTDGDVDHGHGPLLYHDGAFGVLAAHPSDSDKGP